MILNNTINLLKNLSLIGGVNQKSNVYTPMYPMVNTSGSNIDYHSGIITTRDYNAYTYYYSNRRPFSTTDISVRTSYSGSVGYINVVVGSGTTPVSPDDYALESLISTVSMQSGTAIVNYIVDTDAKSITAKNNIKVAVKNTSSESITISELGILHTVYTGSSTSNTASMLVYREVLDTPVTIAAGEFSTFQINIEVTRSMGQ